MGKCKFLTNILGTSSTINCFSKYLWIHIKLCKQLIPIALTLKRICWIFFWKLTENCIEIHPGVFYAQTWKHCYYATTTLCSCRRMSTCLGEGCAVWRRPDSNSTFDRASRRRRAQPYPKARSFRYGIAKQERFHNPGYFYAISIFL